MLGDLPGSSAGRLLWLALAAALAQACRAPEPSLLALRLIDLYRPELVTGTPAPGELPALTEWRFDGQSEGGGGIGSWEAGPGAADLRVEGGRLAGRATGDFPLLHVEWTRGQGNADTLHAVEVRLLATAGATVAAGVSGAEKVDLAEVVGQARDFPWSMQSPLAAGEEVQTLTLRPGRPVPASGVRHLFLRPTDAPGARFAIESVRLVSRREHLAGIPSGVSWQGLGEIYRETLVARAPEAMRFELTPPPGAWLDLGIGTVEDGPVAFLVSLEATGEGGGSPRPLLRRTVTTPYRWEPAPVDLAAFAGRPIVLSLTLAAEKPGTLGLWGSPVVRARGLAPRAAVEPPPEDPPQGVIVVWADTLRRDHLSAYGYERDTSPVLRRMAEEGTLFRRCVAQATWTKVSTPSLLTSLYPATHRVRDFSDRLSAEATTLAEAYREAGYATLSLSSILFTGQFTNLHQGFEELHEDASLPDQRSSKTARVYVDRLLPWLEAHRDGPFFVLVHVSDPHDPYEPAPPYNALWSDPAGKEEHERQAREVRAKIADPLLRQFGMPTREELLASGFDPDRYVAYDRGWYDGSIRAMDVEIGRLLERLEELGLTGKTLVVFTGDHGEEFLEHGRMFHGQSVYGELVNVPLILRRPGHLPAGRVVEETVETVDLMPTLLAASGLAVPELAQGESLLPLLGRGEAVGRAAPGSRPAGLVAFAEKAATGKDGATPAPRGTEAFTVIEGGWKLVHHTRRDDGGPEYELFDHRGDPLDQTDVASAHPELVERLAAKLATWRQATEAAALADGAEAGANLKPEELERLRALGYVR